MIHVKFRFAARVHYPFNEKLRERNASRAKNAKLDWKSDGETLTKGNVDFSIARALMIRSRIDSACNFVMKLVNPLQFALRC